MNDRGDFHSDAGMRALVVVEADEGGDALTCVPDGLEAPLAVDDLCLEDAVHTLCNGVVRGLVDASLLDQYIIIGKSGEAKKIDLPRNLVVWE